MERSPRRESLRRGSGGRLVAPRHVRLGASDEPRLLKAVARRPSRRFASVGRAAAGPSREAMRGGGLSAVVKDRSGSGDRRSGRGTNALVDPQRKGGEPGSGPGGGRG